MTWIYYSSQQISEEKDGFHSEMYLPRIFKWFLLFPHPVILLKRNSSLLGNLKFVEQLWNIFTETRITRNCNNIKAGVEAAAGSALVLQTREDTDLHGHHD